MIHERDYLERTIETVRVHRYTDNPWPSWANIFADEIERLWKIEDAVQKFQPFAEAAEMRWMSMEDATIEVPARAVAEATRALKK